MRQQVLNDRTCLHVTTIGDHTNTTLCSAGVNRDGSLQGEAFTLDSWFS